MAQQNQSVVFRVLQCLGVLRACQPGSHLLQNRFEWKLHQLAFGFQRCFRRCTMADRDVGEIGITWPPAHADAYQLRFEGVEIGCFRIQCNRSRRIGAGLESLHEVLECC